MARHLNLEDDHYTRCLARFARLAARRTFGVDPKLQIVSWPDPGPCRATYVPTAEGWLWSRLRMVELMHEASGIDRPSGWLALADVVTYVPDEPVDRIFVDPALRLDLCRLPLSRTKKGASLCRTFV